MAFCVFLFISLYIDIIFSFQTIQHCVRYCLLLKNTRKCKLYIDIKHHIREEMWSIMKKKSIILSIALTILLIMIGKSFILNESVKYYLVIFMFVGLGLALLRIGVNTAIKKIKGKHIGIKILFFSVF